MSDDPDAPVAPPTLFGPALLAYSQLERFGKSRTLVVDLEPSGFGDPLSVDGAEQIRREEV